MKCYLCKKDVSWAHRHFIEARDGREKSKFRDLCELCYVWVMGKEGYKKNGNCWTKGNN